MEVGKIVDRVKKMLALANDAGATEGERDNALRMSYNLLAKYNLSMADLPEDGVQEVREQQTVTISADRWARSVANSVAELFFCRYFFQRTGVSGKEMHHFVGKQSNCITAMQMTEYLIKSIKRQATAHHKSATSPQGRSFCVGAASSIRQRVTSMLKDDSESTPGDALVLVNLHKSEASANDKWLVQNDITPKVEKARAHKALDRGAYNGGRSYGNTVSLNTQLQGGAGAYKQLH